MENAEVSKTEKDVFSPHLMIPGFNFFYFFFFFLKSESTLWLCLFVAIYDTAKSVSAIIQLYSSEERNSIVPCLTHRSKPTQFTRTRHTLSICRLYSFIAIFHHFPHLCTEKTQQNLGQLTQMWSPFLSLTGLSLQ